MTEFAMVQGRLGEPLATAGGFWYEEDSNPRGLGPRDTGGGTPVPDCWVPEVGSYTGPPRRISAKAGTPPYGIEPIDHRDEEPAGRFGHRWGRQGVTGERPTIHFPVV